MNFEKTVSLSQYTYVHIRIPTFADHFIQEQGRCEDKKVNFFVTLHISDGMKSIIAFLIVEGENLN